MPIYLAKQNLPFPSVTGFPLSLFILSKMYLELTLGSTESSAVISNVSKGRDKRDNFISNETRIQIPALQMKRSCSLWPFMSWPNYLYISNISFFRIYLHQENRLDTILDSYGVVNCTNSIWRLISTDIRIYVSTRYTRRYKRISRM